MARNDGEITYGQLLDQQLGVVRPFTQQVQNVPKLGQPVEAFGQPATEITTIDANASQVKKFNFADIISALEAQTFSYQNIISFDLPSILKSIEVIYNGSSGEGDDNSVGSGDASGSPFQLSLTSNSKSSGSASIIPDTIEVIEAPLAIDIPAITYEFWLPDASSQATLLAKLTTLAGATVLAWPIFKPEMVTLSMGGQTASLSANASVTKSKYVSDDSNTDTSIVDQGYSIEAGVTIRTKEISPTLHAAISLSGTTATANVRASASAGWVGTGSFPSGAAASNPTTTGVLVSGSASPSPNGSFDRIGNLNGFPFYIGGAFFLFHTGTVWKLQSGGVGVVTDYWSFTSSSINPDGTYTAQGANSGSPVVASSMTSVITVTASVQPSTIAATSPTDIPRSGFYLKKLSQQPNQELGIIAFVATVVDMSQFA